MRVPCRARLIVVTVAMAISLTRVVGGCTTSPNSSLTSSSNAAVVVPTRHARDFHALAVGNRWTYRATPGPAPPQPLTIVGFDRGYFVDDRGGRLAPRTDGLFDGERFLLQDPLVVGHAWTAKRADQGVERYRIEADDLTVTVPAGTFTGCVRVTGVQQVVDEPSRQPASLLVTSTWAAGVGPVHIEFRVQVGAAAPVTTSVSELASFVPAVPSAPSAPLPATTGGPGQAAP
jgi:hypothetical protein